jgi:hypothetical protein
VVSATPQLLYPWEDLVNTVQEAGWASEPVWTCGKSCPHQDSISGSSAYVREIQCCCGEVCTPASNVGALAFILNVDDCLVKVYHDGFFRCALRVNAGLVPYTTP